MHHLKPSIAVIHDTRRPNKDNLYPIKLRITFARKQKYYSTGLSLTTSQYELLNNQTALKAVKDIELKRKVQQAKVKCDTLSVKALEITEKLTNFTFAEFEKKFYQNELSRADVYGFYKATIESLKTEGRVGTASNYQSSLSSLSNYKPELNFRDVNVEFLKGYERWLLKTGKSITTVGIYLRPLRAILNAAIVEGVISKDSNYPFGNRRYQIPATRNVKKALTKEEIGKIFHYEAIPGTWWAKAKDFFLFSYLSNGMNMKDILLLKTKDIDGGYIRFVRAKTKNTHKSNSSVISVFIHPELQKIILTWRNSATGENDYLFPFITINASAEKQRAEIQQFTRMVNTYLGHIVKALDIDKKVTTYFARHSFATILKKSGVSTEMISESLGHSSVKTTKSYLDSFDDDTKKALSNSLVDF